MNYETPWKTYKVYATEDEYGESQEWWFVRTCTSEKDARQIAIQVVNDTHFKYTEVRIVQCFKKGDR